MKTLKILLVSLLIASSAFAFGQNERNALLGFGAGILAAHLIHQNSSNYDSHVSYQTKIVEPVRHVVHREPRYEREYSHSRQHHKYEKRYSKHHHKKHNKHTRSHKHDRDVVVINRYNSHYYY